MSDPNHAKGRLAEVKALAHFAAWGCEVAPVLGDNTSCDLMILKDGVPFRVEVKSAQAPGKRRPNPSVTLSSNTHRRSNGSLPNKPVDLSRFDLLAIYDPLFDEVLVWPSNSIQVQKTFSLTAERRAAALRSGEDLVESPSPVARRVGGLCECSDCESLPVTVAPFTLFTPRPL